MKRFPLLIASILLPYFIVAQAFLGLTEGKYNGTTSIFSNPALGLSSKYSWDATIGGGHVFLETNYARLPNSNLFDVYSNYEEIDIIEIDTPLIAYQKPLLFNRIIGKGKVDGHFQIMGPSLNIKIRDDISLGFSIRMRGMFSSYDIPSGLGFYPIQNLPESEVISYSEFDLSTAIWAEYNLHLAKKFDNKQTIGASVRVYSPYGGSYIALHDPFSFVLENGELTTESNFDFKGGLSEISTERKGLGLGIDLGYLKVLNETSRLGISILDIGMMNFSGFTYEAIAGKGDVFLQSDYISKSIDSIFIQLNQDFGHTLGKEGNFALGAPTAISFQYTTNVHKDISVNFNWIQRLKLAKAQLARSNTMSLTGVYDRKHFSAFLPISIYEYSKIRIGAAMRIFFLTVGSDHLGSLMGKNQNFDGTDFYFKVNLYPLIMKNKKGFRSNKKIECFNY